MGVPVRVIVVLAALVAAGVGLTARSPATVRAARGASAVPGPPHTQGGPWVGGTGMCPLAAAERGLPPHSGCVSVVHADVTGDGHPDLVVLYARVHRRRERELSPRGHYHTILRWASGRFTLELIRRGRPTVRTRVAHYASPFLARVGNVNRRPGAELVVEVGRTSSGSNYSVYSWSDGHLVLARTRLAAGGDSGIEAGFACRTGSAQSILVQHVYEPLRNVNFLRGPWRVTATTYAWHGATLSRVGRRTFTRHGVPSRRAMTDGAGCGRVVGPLPSAVR